MKYKLRSTSRFRKELKGLVKRKYDMNLLDAVVEILLAGETLPVKYKDHALKGEFAGLRECHILPDWLLIYKVENDVLILTLTRTGSHSDLFGL